MAGPVAVGREKADELIEAFLPVVCGLESSGVGYGIVGGMGVLIQSYVAGMERFRLTHDVDIMLPEDYSNEDFASEYVRAYSGGDEGFADRVYRTVFGDGWDQGLDGGDRAFYACSVVGAISPRDGFATANVDVVRRLNGFCLDDLQTERLSVRGVEMSVATVAQLAEMKRRTIELLHATPQETTRPQDFIDLARLRELEER